MPEQETRTAGLTGSVNDESPRFENPPGFMLLDEIGRGGMGVVYRARDLFLDRDVAVKFLSARFEPTSATAQRFVGEARITGQLQHPSIPPVHHVGTLGDGRPFLAMKLIKGNTLDTILKQRADHRADRPRLLTIFEAVCQAMGYAHAHRVIHRDLKPANVMVGPFGEVQVMDWGLAKILGTEASVSAEPALPERTLACTEIHSTPEAASHTRAGSVVGTPAFIPPEQALGELDKVNQRSDVFGLGALLTVILTGKPPYLGDSAESVRVQAARGKLEECFARLDASEAEPELIALCKHCLAFEPADRPADAGAVAAAMADLRAAAEQKAQAAAAERVAADARSAEQRRKRSWQFAALATLVVALLAGLAGSFFYLRAQDRANADLRAANEREHERFQLALLAVKTFHTGVSEDVLLKEDEFKSLRDRLLREAAGFYGKLQELLQGQQDTASQRALAEALFLLADLTGKIGSEKEALSIHRQALDLRRQIAARGEAGADLEVARSLLEISQNPSGASGVQQGEAAEEALRVAEASPPTDESLGVLADCHKQLGYLCFNEKQFKEALKHSETALETRQKLALGHPNDVAIQERIADSQMLVGLMLRNLGRNDEAEKAYRAAIATYETQTNAGPGNANLFDALARTRNNLGWLFQVQNQYEQAGQQFAEAASAAQHAIDANPAVRRYKNNKAFFSMNQGRALQKLRLRRLVKLLRAAAVMVFDFACEAKELLLNWKRGDGWQSKNSVRAGLRRQSPISLMSTL